MNPNIFKNNKQTIGNNMAIVKNITLVNASEAAPPFSFYQWDIVCNDKLGTFYTDQKGENIWQKGKGVEVSKTHIYNSPVLDPLSKKYCINVDASIDDIEKQLQGFANDGYFNKFLR
jgi:hypothetical protein